MSLKTGLGKGLSNLLSTEDIFDAETPGFFLCPIEKIRPNPAQPRIKMDEKALADLTESVKAKGLIQPLVVTEKNDEYIPIAGERRWRAAQRAGLKKVPVVIKDYSPDEILEIALIENIQREDLNPIEEALAYKRMAEELGQSQSEIASKVGKDRSTIANLLRLLKLPEEVQKELLEENITTGHAKAILMLDDEALQKRLCKEVIEKGLSVRKTEEIARRLLKGEAPQKAQNEPDPDIEALSKRLSERIGARVKIVPGKKGGKVEIKCSSRDQLERLIGLLASLKENDNE